MYVSGLSAAAGDEFHSADEAALSGAAFTGYDDEISAEGELCPDYPAYAAYLKLLYQISRQPLLCR